MKYNPTSWLRNGSICVVRAIHSPNVNCNEVTSTPYLRINQHFKIHKTTKT